MKVNKNKTKVIIFRIGGLVARNLHSEYDGNDIEIVKSFTY